MKICIDAREVKEGMNGLGRYALNLVRGLARIDRHNQYVVLRHASCPQVLVKQANFSEQVVAYGNASCRNLLTGAGMIQAVQADVYHALFHFLPLGLRQSRVVLTLHDLIWIDHYALSSTARRHCLSNRLAGPLVRWELNACDHVIAVSESTRQAALRRYGLSMDKISVVHHGIDPVFRMPQSPDRLPAACWGRRFIFSLGNTKPYKNIDRLIRAFARILPIHPNLCLAISGRGDGFAFLKRLAHRLGIIDRVLFLGRLSDVEVRACFTHALFFTFPSLVEGFGFPVLEGMAVGCPVLTSNTSSLPEIVGNAALMVDPCDVVEMARGMLHLVNDPLLRKELGRRGKKQAGRFAWETCARQVLGVYNRVVGSS